MQYIILMNFLKWMSKECVIELFEVYYNGRLYVLGRDEDMKRLINLYLEDCTPIKIYYTLNNGVLSVYRIEGGSMVLLCELPTVENEVNNSVILRWLIDGNIFSTNNFEFIQL